MIELRWVYKTGNPGPGFIPVDREAALWQVLQARVVLDFMEDGQQEPVYSEWADIPYGGVIKNEG